MEWLKDTTVLFMDLIKNLKAHRKEIEKKIGYLFKKEDLFFLIFIHRSFYNEKRHLVKEHNERLEFLGDKVLGLIVSNLLYETLPLAPEGTLSSLHSNLVNATCCSEYMLALNIDSYLLLGKGQSQSKDRGMMTILADAFEALIGAIYLDGGFKQADRFFRAHFKQVALQAIEAPSLNYKALLQDYCQKRYQNVPSYQTLEEKGPSHARIFVVQVEVNNSKMGKGKGATKKLAQQMAAKAALKKLKEI